MKALVVALSPTKNVEDVIQIAKAEALKIFKNPGKIRVVDLIRKDYGWVAVVQNSGCKRGIYDEH